MTLNQFADALDRWGSALAHWPERDRDAAFALLEVSLEAQDMMAEAVRLEALVLAYDPAQAIGQDALVRMMNSVMARLPAAAPPRRSWWAALQDQLGLHGATREWAPRFAMSMAVAVVLGLLVGDRLPYNDSQQLSPMETLAMSNTYVPLDLR